MADALLAAPWHLNCACRRFFTHTRSSCPPPPPRGFWKRRRRLQPSAARPSTQPALRLCSPPCHGCLCVPKRDELRLGEGCHGQEVEGGG